MSDISIEHLIDPRTEMYDALRDDSPYDDGRLFGYHSRSEPVWHTTRAAKFRFGFEAEKEDHYGQTIAQLYQGDYPEDLNHGYRAERDGSLNHHGFELISPVYNLQDNAWIEHLQEPCLNFLIHSDTTYRCGGHITVSVKGWEKEDYIKKAAHILPLLYALYPKRAKTAGYARFYNKDDFEQRYNAINITNDKMEIRIFAGIKSLKQLKWRVKLLQLLFCDENLTNYEDIYSNMLDFNSPLAKHIYEIYKKKYGEKIMLTHAYHKAYEKDTLTWKDFNKVRTLIPTGVRNRMQVQPEPVYNNPKQLRIDVCDYCEERSTEA